MTTIYNKAAKLLLALGVLILSAQPAAYAANQKVYEFSIQTAVPSSSLYYHLLEKFAKQINTMSNGRLKADVLAAGAVVGPFQILDAVNNGVVKAGYAWGNYWSGKNSAFVLFSNAPASTGLDQRSLMAWYYKGDGEKLYHEFLHDVMHLDLQAFLMQPMGPDPLGWFKKPIKNMNDFAKFKYRAPPGIPGQTYKDMGVAAVAMPGGDIVPSAQRGVMVALKQFVEKDHVHVMSTPKDYYPKFIASERKITKEYAAKNPFFKKVWESQLQFAKLVYPYRVRILELYYNMVKTAHEGN
ncbi:MAG: hypothetical protein P8076_10470 [Gammaproteobacteria bacterium]